MHHSKRRLENVLVATLLTAFSILVLSACCTTASVAAQAPAGEAASAASPALTTSSNPKPAPLPPLPPGVHELKFTDFFKLPMGRLGPEITDRVKNLDGVQVRILGFMVHQSEPWPNAFLLAPVPVQLHEEEYGQADDLPASTLYVRMPEQNDAPVPFTPGLLLLTGTLHAGPRQIEGERRTWFTLDLNPASPPDSSATNSHDFVERTESPQENSKQ
jgi:hypothetical protein